jgi:hypothetical protein
MRKGELFALQKSDVDFTSGLILVSRSHERDIPKGGRQGRGRPDQQRAARVLKAGDHRLAIIT